MSENKLFDSTDLTNILEGVETQESLAPAAPTTPVVATPQQKAAATRKKNLAAKKLEEAEQLAATTVSTQSEIVQAPPAVQSPPAVPSEPVMAVPVRGKPAKKHKYTKGQMVFITIQRGRDKGEDRPVPVNVQGKQFTVPRGVRVEVPAMVAEVLVNAEESVVEWDGKDSITQRPAASYPTSVHGE